MPTPTQYDQIDPADRRLAAEALAKQRAGQKPTAAERRALTRVKKATEEEARWQHYRTTPKRHYQAMSGRQVKVLNEQARRYGIPCDGATVDLSAVVAWLHDFLAANARKLSAEEGANAEELKKWKARREKLKFETESGQLVPRDDVHTGLAIVARHLRTAGEWLGKQYGREAQERLERALDNAEKALDRHFDRAYDDDRRAG